MVYCRVVISVEGFCRGFVRQVKIIYHIWEINNLEVWKPGGVIIIKTKMKNGVLELNNYCFTGGRINLKDMGHFI